MRRLQFAVLLSLAVAGSASAQVALGRIHGSSSYSPITGFVALIDISDPAVFDVVVTGIAGCAPPNVALNQTDLFAEQQGALVAITANTGPYVGSLGECAVPEGVLIDDETTINPYPPGGLTLYFDNDEKATITDDVQPGVIMINAVGGSLKVGLDGTCNKGTLLVKGGHPGTCSIPKPATIAPRGAIGLDSDRKLLIIVTIDGLETDTGLYTSDLAGIMIGLGAQNAINFDGGGSTSFLWRPGTNPPPEDPKLVTKLLNAKYPAIPNKNNVQFKCVRLDPALGWFNSIPNYPTYRPVYASFGLRYTGALKKVEPRAKE